MSTPTTSTQTVPEGVVYTVALPAGLALLNANSARRMHWRKVRETAREIRKAAFVGAKNARIPRLERARVTYTVHPRPGTSRFDPGNWADSAKAAVDGLVDARVFADDDSTRVIGPDPRAGEPVRGGQLVLRVEPVEAMPA